MLASSSIVMFWYVNHAGPMVSIPFLSNADHLLQVIIQDGSLDVQLVKLHIFCCHPSQQGLEDGLLAA